MNRGICVIRAIAPVDCVRLLLFCIGMAVIWTPEPAVAMPIPESRSEYTGAERQRIRFLNSALIRRAHEYVASEDYSAARRALLEVIANDPGNNRARVMLINVHNQLGDHAEARELVEELLSLYPEYTELYLERAFIDMREEGWASALKDLSTFTGRASPDHPRLDDARENKAEALFQLNRYDEAETLMRTLLARDDTARRRAFLAECALRRYQWEEALGELEAALRLDEDGEAAALYERIGYVQFNLEQYDAAVSAYESALRKADTEADRARLQRQLGYTHFHREDWAAADTALETAAAHYRDPPERTDILHQRGLTAYRDGRYADAADWYAQRLDIGFDEAAALARLDALQEGGMLDEAIRAARAFEARTDIGDAFRFEVKERRLNWHIVREEHAAAHETALSLYEAIDDPGFLRVAAAAAERAGQWEDALSHYAEYLDAAFDAETALDFHYVARKHAARLQDEGAEEAAQDWLERSAAVLERVVETRDAPDPLRRSARYELAQFHRERGERDAYYEYMRQLTEDMPEGRFLFEYAVQLYGDERYGEAAEMFEGALEHLDEADDRFRACTVLADIHLLWNEPEEAIRWLDRARDYGSPGRAWQLARARADYQLERYDDVLERLLPIADDEDVFHMYIAFSFYNRHPPMPGLALAYMNRIRRPEDLGREEQFNFFANRAYLHYDQFRDAETLADIEAALALRADSTLELVRLRALLRSDQFEEVIEHGRRLVGDVEAYPELAGQVYEVMGLAAYRLEQWTDAIEYFSATLERDESLLQARYQRGLAYLHEEDWDLAEEDLMGLTPYADEFPSTFWGDLAFILGDLKEYEAGTEWLDRSLVMYPYDIDAWQERGYQSMKDHRNPDARESFEAGIVLYDEVIPYVEDEDEAETYSETRMSLKQEYTKLDKTWSFQLYGQRTDFDFDERELPAGAPGDSADGALQSQGGISAGFRPPKIGFRNERTLDAFLRVLWNFEPGSWSLDEDSYQGGLGIMYKPFVRHNYVFGFERLFKIGDNAEDNWLWRNTYGIEAGERPLREQDVWVYRRFYGEISYYLESPRRWIFFGQGNIGPSFQLSENLLLTAPEAMLVGRYQDNDPEGVGTYWYYGPGVNFRLLEGERALTRDRWALTAHAHYVWGRFDRSPANIDDNDFEGWIIGVNFAR